MSQIRPQLCVTVTASTTAALRAARDAVADADLIELRLDGIERPDVAGALGGRRTPVIVTCRAKWEGGAFEGSEEERETILRAALDAGAEHVDVEWKAGFAAALAAESGARVVLSHHDFAALPGDIHERVRAMKGLGAAVTKIAVRTSRLSDCLRLADLGCAFAGDGRMVVIGMGDTGLLTRVHPLRFGSAWTYAGALSQVGQITADTLLSAYRFRAVNTDTTLYGIVGRPVTHSVSPAMHNAAFAACGINALYVPLPAVDANDFLEFGEAFLLGASVTIPYKVALFERATWLDEMTVRIGALNTLRRTGHGWEGCNTDLAGFLGPLDARGFDFRGARVSILGAGGSARSVALAVASRGARVTIHARDAVRAAAVAAAAGEAAAPGEWPLASADWDLLVNCTPIGMHPDVSASPVAPELLDHGVVYDLIYNPQRTRLLQDAAHGGATVIGGLDMLVGQAATQFEWWTGRTPDPGVMRSAAVSRLAEFNR